ncbi:hypothetical protein J4233_06005 [Candidatus Pacearchaeota archaeon]|nr:hypothetical protein [Candidatus Pacearchaeota archaeon]
MAINKDLALLNLKYQDYLTYIGVIWTVAISFFVAIVSYLLVSIPNLSFLRITIGLLILVFIEIAFIAIYFFLNTEKNRIKEKISHLSSGVYCPSYP